MPSAGADTRDAPMQAAGAHAPSPPAPRSRFDIIRLTLPLFTMVLIFVFLYSRGFYHGWRLRTAPEAMGAIARPASIVLDALYATGDFKIPYSSDIIGFFASVAVVILSFQTAQVLVTRFGWPRKRGERVALCGGLLWAFAAFNWITLMPAAFISTAGLTIFVALNASMKWFPMLFDPEKKNSAGPVNLFLSLTILSAFFWWPGYQLFLALGMSGAAIGDSVAAEIGRAKGKRELRFTATHKTVEGAIAMFVSTFAVNLLIAYLMIHIPGIQRELFRLMIVLLATSVSTAAELAGPRGLDNLLIGPATALSVYLYVH